MKNKYSGVPKASYCYFHVLFTDLSVFLLCKTINSSLLFFLNTNYTNKEDYKGENSFWNT